MIASSFTSSFVRSLHSARSLLLSMVVISSAASIVDLSKPWELSPLYNQNAAYCAIQSRLSEPLIGYVVVKDGMLIAEGYTENYEATDLNHAWSITKSWTNMLIGRLIGDGQLEMNWTLLHVFSDDQVWMGVVDAEAKKMITLRELLTMTGGLQDASRDAQVNRDTQRTLTGVLNATTYSPELREGGGFKYVGSNHILSRIIFQVSGKTPLQYATDSGIFGALGVENGTHFRWETLGGIEQSATGLYANPRTLAKLGVLFLQNGSAASGLQVVDPGWATASVSNQLPNGVISLFSNADYSLVYHGYGYLWWTDYVEREKLHLGWKKQKHPEQEGAYASLGGYGQIIGVYPEANTVVAIMTNDASGDRLFTEANALLLASTVARNLNGLGEWVKDCNWMNQHGILETVFSGFYTVSVVVNKFFEVVWSNTFGKE